MDHMLRRNMSPQGRLNTELSLQSDITQAVVQNPRRFNLNDYSICFLNLIE